MPRADSLLNTKTLFMTKLLFILLCFSSALLFGQTKTSKVEKEKPLTGSESKNFKIQGLWESYTSLNDTANPGGVQIWYHFGTTKMSALLIPNTGLPPETSAMGTNIRYNLKNDTLKTFDKDGEIMMIVHILNTNLFSIRSPDGKEIEVFYLKRVIKK